MSKYTTEVRLICETSSGLDESKGYNSVNAIITSSLPKIFSFDFPIFDENYRSILETKILKHYYTQEIGLETVGLWKLHLDMRLNEVMPYFNKLYNSELLEFNPLYTHNLERKNKKNSDTNRNENESINDVITNKGTVDSTNNSTSDNTGEEMYSDTPQGSITGLESGTYLTNATRTINNNNNSGAGKVISDENNEYKRTRDNEDTTVSTEDYLENIIGFDGTSGSELLVKYRETFLNIDLMVIDSIKDLFMGLW